MLLFKPGRMNGSLPPISAHQASGCFVGFREVDHSMPVADMGALRGTNRGTELLDANVEELITSLHLRALSEGERILYVDAQIAHGALDLCVAE